MSPTQRKDGLFLSIKDLASKEGISEMEVAARRLYRLLTEIEHHEEDKNIYADIYQELVAIFSEFKTMDLYKKDKFFEIHVNSSESHIMKIHNTQSLSHASKLDEYTKAIKYFLQYFCSKDQTRTIEGIIKKSERMRHEEGVNFKVCK